jgi:hypothetical protein
MAPAQRIQVLLKPDVLDTVKDLTEELDLTLSKTCSFLIEEALEARGKYSTKRRTSSVIPDDLPKDIRQTTVVKKTQPLEDSDLELLSKLKKLKALEEAGLL